MNKHFRLPDGFAVAMGLAILLAAGLFAAFWPQADFSDHERRYLASTPSVPSLTDWETDQEIESYLSDRIPFRRWLVAIDSMVNTLTGRRTQLETWPVDGVYIEQPVDGDVNTVQKRLSQMADNAAKADAPWSVIVPPTHGYLMRDGMSPLMQSAYEKEAVLYDALEAAGETVLLRDPFAGVDGVYYATDHHWTLKGAYLAYEAYCRRVGLEPAPLEAYELTSFENFYGTTYSRSGMPFARADTLDCAQPAGVRMKVLDDDTEYDTLIFADQASTYDGYAVYMNGNHGLTEILNPNAPEGTLMVFKDSFANCLLPLLSANYSRIVAMDARYYSGNFSDAIGAAGEVDRVLYLYSLDSLINDTVVARKIAR